MKKRKKLLEDASLTSIVKGIIRVLGIIDVALNSSRSLQISLLLPEEVRASFDASSNYFPSIFPLRQYEAAVVTSRVWKTVTAIRVVIEFFPPSSSSTKIILQRAKKRKNLDYGCFI